MANDAAPGGPPRPSVTGSSPSERERRIAEGSDSLPGGGTYFLGRYRIVDEIGVGGMASVHLARADGPGGFQKWVAIKRIHRHLAEDETFIRMFLDEARIAARISHPNVAQVFDLGKHRDTYWIAMEYLHGEPLREIMRAVEEGGAPPMSPHLAARIVADAAEGLHAAHELRDKDGKLLNLVHRDVTPHNLFLTYDGAVKVVDFGIAKVTGRLANTRAGTLKGKLAYMSPEQVRGSAIDRRTDIFALGVVLWELTTGRRLFRMESDLETLERVQACVVPPPSSIVENYPVELESIVMRALAKDLNRRFPTAREISRALQQYLMKAGSFVGSEEIGSYVKHVLSDRFQRREAHLQWAAEVTQTISLDQLEGKAETDEEVSLLSYRSDVQQVPRTAQPGAGAPPPLVPPVSPVSTPARSAPTAASPVSRSRPMTAPLAAPRPAAGAPARPLPSFEGTGNTGTEDFLEPEEDDDLAKTRVTGMPQMPPQRDARKQTALGLGPPPAPAPAAGMPPAMHDYGAEDEDAVTTVMAPPSEAEEAQTISTVHEPPKPYRPAAQEPDDAIVVAPTLMMPPEGNVGQGMQTQQAGMYGPTGFATAQPPQREGRSSVLIAVIAAATTLIALTLTALVVLKITEKPQPAPVATVTAPPAPTPAPTPTATAAPSPVIATGTPVQPTAAATPDKPVDPSSLPKETADKPKTGGTPKVGGYKPVPAPATPAPSKEPGFLTVVCDPFCDSVSAGGRSLGPSPVVRAALPPGTHGVGLRSKGVKKSISVTIVSGQTTARRVKMSP